MTTIRTAYAAVLIVNLHGLLASGALIGHLLLYLKGLLERPQHSRPKDVSQKEPPAKV
jgi:hypothetical protein